MEAIIVSENLLYLKHCCSSKKRSVTNLLLGFGVGQILFVGEQNYGHSGWQIAEPQQVQQLYPALFESAFYQFFRENNLSSSVESTTKMMASVCLT